MSDKNHLKCLLHCRLVIETGKGVVILEGHKASVRFAKFSPDGKRVVTASIDKTARIWGNETGKVIVTLKGHEDVVMSAVFSPDGKRVAAAGLDKKIYVFNAFTGDLQTTLEGHGDFIYRVSFNRRGDRLLSCGYSGTVSIWNPSGGKPLFSESLDRVASYADLAPDATRIVVAGGDGMAYFVDVPPAAR